MSKRRFFACGLNFDYEIFIVEPGDAAPDESDWGFYRECKSLQEAKAKITARISNDRDYLRRQLEDIKAITLKGAKR